MIIICGLPGSGKTTLSKKLVEKLGLEYFNDWGLIKENISIEDFVVQNKSKNIVLDLDYANSKIGYFFDGNIEIIYLGFNRQDKNFLVEKFSKSYPYKKLEEIEDIVEKSLVLSELYEKECNKRDLKFYYISKDRDVLLERIFNELRNEIEAN